MHTSHSFKIAPPLFQILATRLISTGTISNTSIYQPQSVTAKLLIIQGHIKMRDDVLYKYVIDECTNLMPFKQYNRLLLNSRHKYATMISGITTALLIESCYSSFYRFYSLIKNEL